jgi:DNA-binding transcriptional LysR family regulator
MNLNDLHMAVVVGREGSLSAAAVRLGVAPGTLSKALARLERATRVRLFERLARGMRPTEMGLAFLARAQRMDLDAADLYAQLRDLRQGRLGLLRLGLGQGIPDRWVEPVARTLVQRGVRLELMGGITDSLARAVGVGELELAVIGLAAAPGGGLAWQRLRDDPMQPMAPPGHPLVEAGRAVRWSDLAAAAWIVPARGTATWAEFERNFERNGLVAPEPVVTSRSSGRERVLAEALGALMLVPRSTRQAGTDLASGLVPVPVSPAWASARGVGVVHRAGGYLSPAAELAIRLLREVTDRGD